MVSVTPGSIASRSLPSFTSLNMRSDTFTDTHTSSFSPSRNAQPPRFLTSRWQRPNFGSRWVFCLFVVPGRSVDNYDKLKICNRYPHNTPQTKEAYFIRMTYESFYPEEAAAKVATRCNCSSLSTFFIILSQCVPGGPSVACSSAAAVRWDESFMKFAGLPFLTFL